MKSYMVQAGDTLWKIAQEQLGNPYLWHSLWLENQDRIKNPDLIYPDQVLRLPRGTMQGESA